LNLGADSLSMKRPLKKRRKAAKDQFGFCTRTSGTGRQGRRQIKTKRESRELREGGKPERVPGEEDRY